MKYLFTLILITISFSVFSQPFPIPNDKEVSYDVIRKKKTIGSLVSKFIEEDEKLIIHSVLDIDVKVLFFSSL